MTVYPAGAIEGILTNEPSLSVKLYIAYVGLKTSQDKPVASAISILYGYISFKAPYCGAHLSLFKTFFASLSIFGSIKTPSFSIFSSTATKFSLTFSATAA